jgi:hypothetical protein
MCFSIFLGCKRKIGLYLSRSLQYNKGDGLYFLNYITESEYSMRKRGLGDHKIEG